jgi:hypothetical protein
MRAGVLIGREVGDEERGRLGRGGAKQPEAIDGS